MSEAVFVDLQWRGLKLAHRARFVEDGGEGGFVELEAPLPVGAIVTLSREGAEPREARVVGVVEQEAGAKSSPGMKLRWGGGAEPSGEMDAMTTTKVEGEEGAAPRKGRGRKKKPANGR